MRFERDEKREEKERRERGKRTNLELLLSSLKPSHSLVVDSLVLEVTDVGLLLDLESLVVVLGALRFGGSSVSLDLLKVRELLDRVLENFGLVLLLLLEDLGDSLSVLVCKGKTGRDDEEVSSSFTRRRTRTRTRQERRETYTQPCGS